MIPLWCLAGENKKMAKPWQMCATASENFTLDQGSDYISPCYLPSIAMI